MAMGFFVFTKSTLTPFDNMGVMTMKMISMTSITSTIGVTLISFIGGGAFCFCIWLFLHFIKARTIASRDAIVLEPNSTRRGRRTYYFLAPDRCDRFRK